MLFIDDAHKLEGRKLDAVAIGMGAWELAAVLGGLKLLGSGRRAARQT